MDGYGTNTMLFISRFSIMFFMRKFKNITFLLNTMEEIPMVLFLTEYHHHFLLLLVSAAMMLS
jgi:hypothetical protein